MDRLCSNEKVKTYIFKYKDDLVGFFELISHGEKKKLKLLTLDY